MSSIYSAIYNVAILLVNLSSYDVLSIFRQADDFQVQHYPTCLSHLNHKMLRKTLIIMHEQNRRAVKFIDLGWKASEPCTLILQDMFSLIFIISPARHPPGHPRRPGDTGQRGEPPSRVPGRTFFTIHATARTLWSTFHICAKSISTENHASVDWFTTMCCKILYPLYDREQDSPELFQDN